MQDRRNTVRTRSFLGGKIIFNNRNSSLDCLVRNLSPQGARIILSEAVVVPDEFELEIPQKGHSFRAKLKWRNASECGVRLLGASTALRMRADDMAARLRTLEKERAALQARVAALSSAS